MSFPLISLVMPTMPSRRPFIHQAIKYVLRQTYPNKELVIVDSAPGNPEEFAGYPDFVRYFEKEGNLRIGAKLNYGIEKARGDILHKTDDDDWYHPEIISDLWKLISPDPERSVTRLVGAGVLLLSSWKFKITPDAPWILGASIMFHRRFWERNTFREDIERGVDHYFRLSSVPHSDVVLPRKDRLVFVRHGLGHTWNEERGMSVDRWLSDMPDHPSRIEEFFSPEDLVFYSNLRKELSYKGTIA